MRCAILLATWLLAGAQARHQALAEDKPAPEKAAKPTTDKPATDKPTTDQGPSDKPAAKKARAGEKKIPVRPAAAYRDQLRKTVPGLLTDRKFKDIDALADDLRAKQSRVSSGSLKLTQLYEVLADTPGAGKPADYDARIKLLESWVEQEPESFTARVTLARTWEQYGWLARGGGYADTVSEENHDYFKDRCTKAADILQQAEQLKTKDPELYAQGILLAIDLSWSHEVVERICDDSVKLDPTFLRTLVEATRYYLPRWYGDTGDLEKFALDATKKTEKACGKTVYAWIVFETERHHGFTVFHDFQFDWKLVKQGFEDWNRQYPTDQWRLQAYCRMACMARDRTTAHALFEKIGPKGLDAIWTSPDTFRFFKRWAEPDFAQGDQRTIIEKICVPINGLAWTTSPDWLAVIESSGPVSFLHPATQTRVVFGQMWPSSFGVCIDRASDAVYTAGYGGRVWKFGPSEQAARGLVLGNHGGDVTSIVLERGAKTVATAGQGGAIKLWNTEKAGPPELLKTDGKRVGSIDVDATHNLLAAGIDTGTAMIWSLNRRTAAATWKAHPTSVDAVAYSPDGVLLATACAQEVKLWNADDQKLIATLQCPPNVSNLIFTPDGKHLVGGTGTSDASLPAVVVVWEVAGRQLVKTLSGHKGPITAIAISLDGQTILTSSWDTSIRLWDIPK
ncbi:MAG TPA: hypothetical protein VG433_12580 [Pirellulales bacterium]|nr:hypothetical protein [Pirellulales bacterium]